MPTLLQDIKTQTDWIIKAFESDKLKLDFTIHSFMEIDRFFNKHTKAGKALKGGRLFKNKGVIIFSLGAYVGETIVKNVSGSKWETDDKDPNGELNVSIKFPDGSIIFPIQKVMKRFQNGFEDAIYVYGYHVTKDYIHEDFDQSFWELGKEKNSNLKKPWWKFW